MIKFILKQRNCSPSIFFFMNLPVQFGPILEPGNSRSFCKMSKHGIKNRLCPCPPNLELLMIPKVAKGYHPQLPAGFHTAHKVKRQCPFVCKVFCL